MTFCLPDFLVEVFDLLLETKLEIFAPAVELADFLIQPLGISSRDECESLGLLDLDLLFEAHYRRGKNWLTSLGRQIEQALAGVGFQNLTVVAHPGKEDVVFSLKCID